MQFTFGIRGNRDMGWDGMRELIYGIKIKILFCKEKKIFTDSEK